MFSLPLSTLKWLLDIDCEGHGLYVGHEYIATCNALTLRTYHIYTGIKYTETFIPPRLPAVTKCRDVELSPEERSLTLPLTGERLPLLRHGKPFPLHYDLLSRRHAYNIATPVILPDYAPTPYPLPVSPTIYANPATLHGAPLEGSMHYTPGLDYFMLHEPRGSRSQVTAIMEVSDA